METHQMKPMITTNGNQVNTEDVVSPSRYTQGNIQVWDFIHDQGLSYDEGNVVKYVVRHKNKNGLEDIMKGIQYLKHIALTEYGVNLD